MECHIHGRISLRGTLMKRPCEDFKKISNVLDESPLSRGQIRFNLVLVKPKMEYEYESAECTIRHVLNECTMLMQFTMSG